MKSSKFLRELKILINLIRQYGIHHIDFTIKNPKHMSDKQKDEFIKNVHNGFFLAQNNAIMLLRKILAEQKKLKSDLKEYRRNRNNDKIQETKNSLNYSKYQEYAIRKIMDSIVWQIFNYDLSSLRRLYFGNEHIDITDSNLDSEINFISHHAQENPLDFVLINDLTSFVQVGDVIVANPKKKISIIELKDGEKNMKILNLIEECIQTPCPIFMNKKLEGKNDKFIEHFKRDIKQLEKTSRVSEVLNTGKGIDLNLGKKVRIVNKKIYLSTYLENVLQLLNDSKKKGYAISVIEGCLLIGIYDTNKFPDIAFDVWAKSLNIAMPIFDLKQSLAIPLAYPIFLHPFSDNTLVGIVLGDIVIKMTLDIDKFLKMFECAGFTVTWLNKKQTSRISSELKGSNRIFEIDGCGVQIEKDDRIQYLCDGIFLRMFTEFNTPSSIVKYFLSTNEYLDYND